MKLILRTFFSFLFLALALTGCSDSNTPKDGDQYMTIAKPISDMQGVYEVFSLSCGHCRSMETMLPEIKKLAGVKDIRSVHVTFNESAQLAAFVYYAAAIQSPNGEPSDKLTEQLFAYTQDTPKDTPMDKRKEMLNNLFAQYKMNSPYQLTQTQQEEVFSKMDQAQKIIEAANITSVPTFIVNGKYLVNTPAHKNLQDLANTIKYLEAK
ncbi:thiol:disulfide interchange protein DsbA/DsbL [Photobacterium damselae]|uniref:Thiol:disulfide interchange protein DsbA/DsbL n=1 Tax=Photobacterium damselae subsp. damselae TaxID=85581 RepID=A0AAD3WUD0_PHODD|nr:thiol:disulfide interchange protein DsbA/DsbL [Photobacterium damselae]KAB1179324.1 thiol:disulfide interchange protein DsbA/DsbL [Photobacterium damselae subsp. damselae]